MHHAAVAEMGERLPEEQQAEGSITSGGTVPYWSNG